MSAAKDGGLAFPVAWTDTNQHGVEFPMLNAGMTLRQFYAAQAAAGIAARGSGGSPPKMLAEEAFSYADAMIAFEQEGGAR